jgi:hypothetical protein
MLELIQETESNSPEAAPVSLKKNNVARSFTAYMRDQAIIILLT